MSERTPQPPRRVLSAIRDHPWAMLPSAFEAMLEVVNLRMQGVRRPEAEIQAALEAAARPQTVPISTSGSIAILSLTGILAQRMDMFMEISGGTSLEGFAASFRQALADPNITTILLNIDSPGGSVFLVQETGDLIYNARGQGTEIIAVANSMADSAAYWLASQADRFVMTPGGEVGSIGVICMHENLQGMDEMMGYECTYLSYPEGGYKAEGNPHEPLSEEARAHLMGRLTKYGMAFESAVARGRGVRVARVQKDFGRGRVVGAEAALSLGMVDQVASMQEVLDKLTKKKSRSGGARAVAVVEGAESSLPITGGPGEAPMLREGSDKESCMNCRHYSKPSMKHDGGTCKRHNFHAMDMWNCDDHEHMPEQMEEVPEDEGGEMEERAAAVVVGEAGAAAVAATEEVAAENSTVAAAEEDDGETVRLVALARLRLASRRVA